MMKSKKKPLQKRTAKKKAPVRKIKMKLVKKSASREKTARK